MPYLTAAVRDSRDKAPSEAEPVPGFVPAVIVPEPRSVATPQTASSFAKAGDDRIEIVLARGRRIIVGSGVNAAALSRILDVLERR
jgi:transposase